MTPAEVAPEEVSPAPSRLKTWAFAVGAAVVATAWYMGLSEWLRFTPGSPLTTDSDVIFNSDAAAWTEWLAGEGPLQRPSPLHALLNVVWRPAARGLFALFHAFLPYDQARILAARALVAMVAGAGFGCIAALTMLAGVSRGRRMPLLLVCLLFSSNVLVVSPEHWGLSHGLLCGCGLIVWLDLAPRRKLAYLTFLTILTAGTTVTNAVYPGAALARILAPPRSLEWMARPRSMAIAGFTALVLFAAAVASRPVIHSRMPRLTEHVTGYVHLRLIREPARAAIDSLTGLVYPAIAPMPELAFEGRRLTFQYYERSTWAWTQVVAAGAWIVLLARCGVGILRSPDARGYGLGLLGWILFNLAFHSIWGDELFLYTAHWSWCLALIVLLGSRAVSPAFLAACVVLLIPGQLTTLYQIGRALRAM